MSGRDQHTSNIVVGAGELYIDLLDSDGNLTGERYLGDSIGAALSIATERASIFSGDGPVAQELVNIARNVTRSMTLTLHDMSPENQALFIVGETEAASLAATAVTDEELTVKRGRWYQLGQTAANPLGAWAGATLGNTKPVTDDANTPVEIAKAKNWEFDADTGRLYILPNATGIADGDVIKVDYTPKAATATAAKSGDAKTVLAAIRYLEDAAEGEGRHIYARRCSIAPGGESALKSAGRDTEQQLTLTASIQESKVSGTPALLINGKAV